MASQFVDIEGNPKQMVHHGDDSDAAVEDVLDSLETDMLISQQPTRSSPAPMIHHKKIKRSHKSRIISKEPPPVQDTHGLFRRNRKAQAFQPVPLEPRITGHPGVIAQSAAGGWVDESDSDDVSDVFEEVKTKVDITPPFFIIVSVVLVVIISVTSVLLYEKFILGGKPEIPENTFSFLRKDGDEL